MSDTNAQAALLSTKDVTVTYDLTHEALHKTSLEFRAGEVTAPPAAASQPSCAA